MLELQVPVPLLAVPAADGMQLWAVHCLVPAVLLSPVGAGQAMEL